MTVPLLLLGAAAVVAGFVGAGFLGQPLQGFLGLGEGGAAEAHGVPVWLTAVAVAVGVLGVGGAWFGYGRSAARRAGAGGAVGFDARLEGALGPVYSLVARGYRVDDLYAFLVVRPFTAVGRFLWRAVDGSVIDGLLDGVAALVPRAGGLVHRVQSGEVRDYLAAMAVGVILVVALAVGALK